MRAVVREARREPARSFAAVTCSGRSTVLARIPARLDLDARVLVLDYESFGACVEVRVSLDVTSPHFGGVRWWARCPGCRARVAFLYLDLDLARVECRTCAGLAYASTRECPLFRALRRARKLEERLARRSWGSTRARLVARVEAAYEAMGGMLGAG
ncbi:hypothetical protein [Polyangium sp. 15x6]|uniref:hypothetical protein n=1 Tax=Polyangium sp. 15x6 TaxID=3042687 RepID=UPI00249CEBB0|nr:hypothetical protein [Polyangium sp. 15x6]MDI3291967.1 hypothetical protein [Polyangium sp. 15x6]